MLLKSSVDKWQLPQQSGYGSEIEQLKKALLQQQQATQSIGAGPDFLSSLKKLMDLGGM